MVDDLYKKAERPIKKRLKEQFKADLPYMIEDLEKRISVLEKKDYDRIEKILENYDFQNNAIWHIINELLGISDIPQGFEPNFSDFIRETLSKNRIKKLEMDSDSISTIAITNADRCQELEEKLKEFEKRQQAQSFPFQKMKEVETRLQKYMDEYIIEYEHMITKIRELEQKINKLDSSESKDSVLDPHNRKINRKIGKELFDKPEARQTEEKRYNEMKYKELEGAFIMEDIIKKLKDLIIQKREMVSNVSTMESYYILRTKDIEDLIKEYE